MTGNADGLLQRDHARRTRTSHFSDALTRVNVPSGNVPIFSLKGVNLMQSVTVYAPASHGLEFTTLAALGVTAVVVGMIIWQVIARMRAMRHDDQLGHPGH